MQHQSAEIGFKAQAQGENYTSLHKFFRLQPERPGMQKVRSCLQAKGAHLYCTYKHITHVHAVCNNMYMYMHTLINNMYMNMCISISSSHKPLQPSLATNVLTTYQVYRTAHRAFRMTLHAKIHSNPQHAGVDSHSTERNSAPSSMTSKKPYYTVGELLDTMIGTAKIMH